METSQPCHKNSTILLSYLLKRKTASCFHIWGDNSNSHCLTALWIQGLLSSCICILTDQMNLQVCICVYFLAVCHFSGLRILHLADHPSTSLGNRYTREGFSLFGKLVSLDYLLHPWHLSGSRALLPNLTNSFHYFFEKNNANFQADFCLFLWNISSSFIWKA